MFNTNPDCARFIAEGKCKADCCGVPFEYHQFMQIKHLAYEKNYEIKKFKAMGVQFVTAIAEDGMCVFLDREKHSCNIYRSPRKPDICRKFGMSQK